MAPKATIYKAELQVTDLDRHYYASHALTLAQHPSETETRLLVRLLAFALHADERLEFGRGLSDEDEPALWRRDYTGAIDPAILRTSCGIGIVGHRLALAHTLGVHPPTGQPG